jgi:hypothetical protein
MKRIFLFVLFATAVLAQAANRNVVLTWTPPTTGAPSGGYTLTRATSNGTPQQLYAGPLLTFTDPGASIGQTYTYSITAVGPACPTVTTTTAPNPNPPACGSSALLSIIVTIPAGTGTVVGFLANTP